MIYSSSNNNNKYIVIINKVVSHFVSPTCVASSIQQPKLGA